MTATATATEAQRAGNRARQARWRATHPQDTALIAAQHETMLRHIEDFVFFVTVCGMSQLEAAARCGVTEHTMDRWLRFLAEPGNRQHGYWHAAPTRWTAYRNHTSMLPHVLDCPRNHNTTGAR